VLTRRERAQRYSTLATVLGAFLALFSAISMRDHVRLVEIIELFFGGLGTGAGLVNLVRQRAQSADAVD
jgi:hypothetical protein